MFSRQVMSDSSRPHGLSLSIELVMKSNHLILCHLLLLLPSIFPSIKVFSYESALRIRWRENWSFSISPSKEYSGLISFKIVWFNFLAFQGTLMSLLQNCSSKASILQRSAFFMVQLSHPYMTTGKTIAWTIVDLCQQSDAFAFYVCIKHVILLEKFHKHYTDCPKFQGTAKMGCIWGCRRGAFLCSCNETEFTKLRWLTCKSNEWLEVVCTLSSDFCPLHRVLPLRLMRAVLPRKAASGGTFCAPSALSPPPACARIPYLPGVLKSLLPVKVHKVHCLNLSFPQWPQITTQHTVCPRMFST